MLAGPKRAVFGPNEPPRSDRAIADSWRGLYGSAPFSSTLPDVSARFLGKVAIGANISVFAGFLAVKVVRRRGGNPPTLAIRNLTGLGAGPHPAIPWADRARRG